MKWHNPSERLPKKLDKYGRWSGLIVLLDRKGKRKVVAAKFLSDKLNRPGFSVDRYIAHMAGGSSDGSVGQVELWASYPKVPAIQAAA